MNKIHNLNIECWLKSKYMRVIQSTFTKTNPQKYSNRGRRYWIRLWTCSSHNNFWSICLIAPNIVQQMLLDRGWSFLIVRSGDQCLCEIGCIALQVFRFNHPFLLSIIISHDSERWFYLWTMKTLQLSRACTTFEKIRKFFFPPMIFIYWNLLFYFWKWDFNVKLPYFWGGHIPLVQLH